MANAKQRLDANVPGNFYVDRTCINCDTCRQLAPQTFEEVGNYSVVVRQPRDGREVQQAHQALVACPVGSIGTERRDRARVAEALASFPLHLERGVFYCGFNSDKSFGANSYLVTHPDGNWLIDSPHYAKRLAEAFERMGGIRQIFLTHEVDVADADRYAKHFGARRIIHRADADAAPDAEWIVDGSEAVMLAPSFQLIPVPGHTPGSSALLYDERFLFTGDHLWWEPSAQQLGAPHNLVWHHGALVRSLERLRQISFEWVLAGHGDRVHLPRHEMQARVCELLERRRAVLSA